MPMKLEGSCHCGAVRFAANSRAPAPFMRCYCSICRKKAGGGGYAINLHADMWTLTVDGNTTQFHAVVEGDEGRCRISSGERHFCARCGSALWAYSPEYPDLCHPFASAIDTELPKPPSLVHMMLGSKAAWVEPEIGPRDQSFEGYPDSSLEEWHRTHDLWID